MAITAVILFASALRRAAEASNDFWPWLRRLLESAIGAILFLGLLWAFRSILNDNSLTFFATHGSLSDVSRESAQSIWGRPHVQKDLSVSHFIEVEVEEELPREDPTLPPLYRTIKERRQVPQNSLLSFRGDVEMELSERQKGYAYYSGFVLKASFQYEVINDSELQTEAEFYFPLSPGQTLFQEFAVTIDGVDISPELRFSEDMVSWKRIMSPQQRSEIIISYISRGMDYFYYQVPVQREIKDFELTLAIDRLPISQLNYPDGVLTPTEIDPTPDNNGSLLTWKLDRAVTVAGMGVALPKPEQPGANVLRILVISPYALTMLVTVLALTFLIFGEPLHFIDLALFAAVYCVQFLVMAGVSDYAFGFWGSMVLGAALTGFLGFLLFRRLPSKLLRGLIYGLIAFFTLAYPLSGLLTEITQLDAFNNIVLVGLIIYIFGLALYKRTERVQDAK